MLSMRVRAAVIAVALVGLGASQAFAAPSMDADTYTNDDRAITVTTMESFNWGTSVARNVTVVSTFSKNITVTSSTGAVKRLADGRTKVTWHYDRIVDGYGTRGVTHVTLTGSGRIVTVTLTGKKRTSRTVESPILPSSGGTGGGPNGDGTL